MHQTVISLEEEDDFLKGTAIVLLATIPEETEPVPLLVLFSNGKVKLTERGKNLGFDLDSTWPPLEGCDCGKGSLFCNQTCTDN